MRIAALVLVAVGPLVAQPAAVPLASGRVTLDQAVKEAIDHNLSLLADRYNVAIADARIVTAKLRPNPVFSAGLDYLDILGSGFNATNAAGPSEYNLRTDYVWERGGKRERRVEVATGQRDVARLQLLDATRTLVLDVQNAFLDVLQARDNLELARANLQSFQGIVDVNTARVRTGDLARVELVRTQVAALQFQNAVHQAESRLRAANNKLQLLMGRTTPSPTFTVDGEMRRDTTPVSLDEIQAQAFAKRPDLLAARQDSARSLAELRWQLAQRKVDFTIGTEFHRQFDNGVGSSLGFFFSAPIPLFNRNQGEVERARQEIQQVQARVRVLEASIQADVQSAWLQYSTSRQLLETIEREMLGQAREVRDTMEYSYRRGEASLVEFLDAQRAFNDARQSYNEARADYARSLYAIDSISGRDVQ